VPYMCAASSAFFSCFFWSSKQAQEVIAFRRSSEYGPIVSVVSQFASIEDSFWCQVSIVACALYDLFVQGFEGGKSDALSV
jgi:hypothetical protein